MYRHLRFIRPLLMKLLTTELLKNISRIVIRKLRMPTTQVSKYINGTVYHLYFSLNINASRSLSI